MRLRSDKAFLCAFALLVIFAAAVAFRVLRVPRNAYLAESLLAARGFTNSIARQAFERQLLTEFPGMERVDFQFSTSTQVTLKGKIIETNCVVRLVAGGATEAIAENVVRLASDAARHNLESVYGVIATPIDQIHVGPEQSVREKLSFQIGYKHPGPFPTAGRVHFPIPGVSIEPGNDWTRHYVAEPAPGNDPMLIGERKFNGAFIDAFILNPQINSMADALAAAHPSAAKYGGLIESSYAEEPFKTESGLTGVLSSFTRKYWAGNLITQTIHNYVFTNASSKYVVLRYLTVSGKESGAVDRMIRKSLQIESQLSNHQVPLLTNPSK